MRSQWPPVGASQAQFGSIVAKTRLPHEVHWASNMSAVDPSHGWMWLPLNGRNIHLETAANVRFPPIADTVPWLHAGAMRLLVTAKGRNSRPASRE